MKNDLLIIYALTMLGLVAYIASVKFKKKRSGPLNLSANPNFKSTSRDEPVKVELSHTPMKWKRKSSSASPSRSSYPYSKARKKSKDKPSGDIDGPRPLNVFFNFNGHPFEAHEVLGILAGASSEVVEEAYQRQLAGDDGSSVEFFDLARKCIENGRK